jgi:hypothetical protein
MKWLLFSFCCCLLAQANAQTRFEYTLDWSDGSVVSLGGDTIECRLRYNQALPEPILQVMDGEYIRCLSVKDVAAFSYFDAKKNRLRSFQPLQVPFGEFEGQMYFCERLYNNSRFSILRHRALTVPYEFMNYSRFVRKPVMLNQRYIYDSSAGKLLPLSRENALLLMQAKRPQVSDFIQNNGIKLKNVTDYIRVLEYYSSL